MIKQGIIAFILLLSSTLSWAQSLDIVVVGLFSNQAVVMVDGQQHILKVGKTTPEGVKLIAANSREAVLEVNGTQQTFPLGSHISTNFTGPAKQPTVTLWPTNGMYLTPGTVNGYSVDFLVDTGASSIALNAATARRLGIDFYRGERIGVTTASGKGLGYRITLDSVQVDGITLYNIDAVVLDGAEPAIALLGMTFLGQLDIRHDGDKMELKKKF
jgi:aspartyl protease family protein